MMTITSRKRIVLASYTYLYESSPGCYTGILCSDIYLKGHRKPQYPASTLMTFGLQKESMILMHAFAVAFAWLSDWWSSGLVLAQTGFTAQAESGFYHDVTEACLSHMPSLLYANWRQWHHIHIARYCRCGFGFSNVQSVHIHTLYQAVCLVLQYYWSV